MLWKLLPRTACYVSVGALSLAQHIVSTLKNQLLIRENVNNYWSWMSRWRHKRLWKTFAQGLYYHLDSRYTFFTAHCTWINKNLVSTYLSKQESIVNFSLKYGFSYFYCTFHPYSVKLQFEMTSHNITNSNKQTNKLT